MLQKIKPHGLLIVLIAIDLSFVIAHHATSARPFFNLDAEVNLPTFYQAIKLVAVAILALLFIYFSKLFLEMGKKVLKLFWAALSAAALYLATDEMIQVHEKAQMYATSLFGEKAVDTYEDGFAKLGFDSAEWLPFYIPVLLVGITFFVLTFKNLRKTYKHDVYLLAAAAAIFCIPFLMELIATSETFYNTNMYQIFMTIEEFAEMLGGTVLIYFVWRRITALKLEPQV